ncbi:MATE family efflux transporter [Chromatiales bacterium (ex Bugula neritina AB1)]|nr:MATE family efflux transporter [Chromatiales bacterium (ex Bugula neritina AB1)]
MSFTSSIGLMAIFAVDLIDMLFIAMLGNPALAAAIGYSGTVLFFTTSIGIGFSIAAGVLVARAIGAGQPDQAAGNASSVVVVGVLISVVTVLCVFLFMPDLLDLLGAQGETRALAVSYLSIILPSMPLLMAAMVAMAVLRAHGDAKRATLATLAGGVVNAALDPLLIFSAGLGLEGAAVASVFARLTIFIAAIYPAIKTYRGFARPSFSALRRDFSSVSIIGVPAVLANIATPVGTGIVTREMARFGTDAVAGMAIIGRLTPVAFAVVFALSGAIGPIIGQNFGAGLHARVRAAFLTALGFVSVYVTVVALLLYLLRGFVVSLFDASGETLTIVLLFCGPLAFAQLFNGWVFVGNATFNNLGHPVYSTWVNWGRHTVGTWLPVVFFASLWGAAGVLIGQALGGIVFAVVTVWLAMRMMDGQLRAAASLEFSQHQRMHILECRRH